MKLRLGLLVAHMIGLGFIAQAQDYVRTIPIKSGDVLFMRVWGHPNLDTRIEVMPDGRITLPVVGEVHADGLNLEQLKERCEVAYASYLRTPPHVGVIFIKLPKPN
jgi:polysaccharide export outer membrane protein